MNSTVVVLLVVVWASIFVPGVLRVRRDGTRSAGAGTQEDAGAADPQVDESDRGEHDRDELQRLGSALAPIPRAKLARRGLLLSSLLVATAVTIPMAVLFGGVATSVALVAAGGLLVDLVILRHLKARRDSLRRKLRFLQVPRGDGPPGAGHAAERVPRGEQADSPDQRRRA